MFQEEFVQRLIELRQKKNVSAREMSLAIGQNERYINSIETGRTLPSIAAFFCICDYLEIAPKDFFDLNNDNLEVLILIEKIRHLDAHQIQLLSELVENFKN